MSFPILPRLRPSGCGDPGSDIPFSLMLDTSQYATCAVAAANSKRWTLSAWVRRNGLANVWQPIFGSWVGGYYDFIGFHADKLAFHQGYEGANFETTALYRDLAAWAHIVLRLDSDNATASQRLRATVNGVDMPLSGYPAQGWASKIGAAGTLRLGGEPNWGWTTLELADVIYLPDALVDPTAFGYMNRFSVWVPKKYAGTYSTQGFRLDFADPLSLGKDVSGKGNHFTPTGLTLSNQLTDTPTHAVNTNNPLNTQAVVTLSNGNLTGTYSGVVNVGASTGTIPVSSGRYYWEVKVNTVGTYETDIGALPVRSVMISGNPYSYTSGIVSSGEVVYCKDGGISRNGTYTAYGAAFGAGDTIGVLIDCEANTINFSKNGVWQGAVPLCALPLLTTNTNYGGSNLTSNFGQRSFAYAIPAGAKALNTANLKCPAIKRPERYFTTRLRSAAAAVTDLPWSPLAVKTLVLSKRRDGTTDWRVNDSLRPGRAWATNTAAADFAEADGLTFTDTGFAIGAAAAYAGSRIDYIWRASAAAGFDMILVDHVAGTPTTVPHAAGGIIDYAWVVPLAGGNRRVYHRALAAGKYLTLDGTGAAATDAGWFASSAVGLTLGASLPTGRYALYLWRAVPGFSAFGSYASNYSADGPFLPMDFRPAALLAKYDTTGTTNGVLIDAARSPNNPVAAFLNPNATSVEGAATLADFVAGGVKVRMVGTDLSTLNFTSAGTFVYAAWAETPLKFARAR